MTSTRLWGPGLAVPPHRLTRRQTVEVLTRILRLSAKRRAWLQRVCDASAVDQRFTCVGEFARYDRLDLSSGPSAVTGEEDLFGGLAGRMERYRKTVVPLALAAAQAALRRAALPGAAVTHLVWVTCTGLESPGPDLDLADQLGVGRDAFRLQIGFSGCHASAHGLRVADWICQSEVEAVVLLVCAELCTLHLDPGRDDAESLVIASLFGDGAAALVASRRSTAVTPQFDISDFASRRVPEAAGLLTWRLGEPAFRMGLGRRLPEAVGACVQDFALQLRPTTTPAEQLGWAIHPGGRAVLDAAGAALGLTPEQLEPSRSVLARYGNMSSPSLLFALDAVPDRFRQGVGLALGPGLSLEGFRWSRAG